MFTGPIRTYSSREARYDGSQGQRGITPRDDNVARKTGQLPPEGDGESRTFCWLGYNPEITPIEDTAYPVLTVRDIQNRGKRNNVKRRSGLKTRLNTPTPNFTQFTYSIEMVEKQFRGAS